MRSWFITLIITLVALGSYAFISLIQLKYEIHKAPIDNQQQLDEVDDIRTALCSIYYLNDWEARYYAYMFHHLADTFKVDWQLIAAVVWIESRFDVMAKSEKDAKGVIQMLESTAKIQAKKLGIPYKKNCTVWNPLVQLPLGVSYLSTALKKGGYENAIKGYIGGPGWKKANKENREKHNVYFSKVSFEHKRITYQFKGVQGERVN